MDQQPPYDPDSYLQPNQYDPNQYAQQQPQYDPNQYVQQPQYAQQPQQQQQYYDPNQYVQQPQQQQFYNPNQYVQQPQYAQQPQYVQPQQYNPQPMQMGQDDGGKNSNTANVMCIISLVCMYVIPIVAVIISGGLSNIADKDESITSMFASAMSLAISASGLAAWVLMIIVRVKYPKNVFGKVLMWLYIIMLVLGVIGIIVLFVACINTLRNCPG